MEKTTLQEELKKYEDQWVAILDTENRVVGSGPDASVARRDAKEKGYEDVILLRVLPFRGAYVPAA